MDTTLYSYDVMLIEKLKWPPTRTQKAILPFNVTCDKSRQDVLSLHKSLSVTTYQTLNNGRIHIILLYCYACI